MTMHAMHVAIMIWPFAFATFAEAAPPVDEREVLDLLNGIEFKEGLQTMIGWGADAFPIYSSIFEHKECSSIEKSRILLVLRYVKADRTRFLEMAVSSLTNQDGNVRTSAIELLAKIGGTSDGAPLVALLSDGQTVDSHTVPYAAAKALAAIGGLREVVAMDAWLLGGSHADNKDLRTHVKKCRDELAARLAKEPKKK